MYDSNNFNLNFYKTNNPSMWKPKKKRIIFGSFYPLGAYVQLTFHMGKDSKWSAWELKIA